MKSLQPKSIPPIRHLPFTSPCHAAIIGLLQSKEAPMYAVYSLISFLVQLYIFVIVLQVALSWLIAFDVVNANNDAAKRLTETLKKLTDPVYTPIRKFVPPIGGIDLTPLIVIIGIQLLAGLLLPHPYRFL